jgi:hypothetical protein
MRKGGTARMMDGDSGGHFSSTWKKTTSTETRLSPIFSREIQD